MVRVKTRRWERKQRTPGSFLCQRGGGRRGKRPAGGGGYLTGSRSGWQDGRKCGMVKRRREKNELTSAVDRKPQKAARRIIRRQKAPVIKIGFSEIYAKIA